MTNIGSVGWGSWPSIPLSFAYEKRRNGADMQYRFQVVIGQVWSMDGSQYFGYPIYCNILLDGVDASGQLTLKNSAPSSWGGTIPYTSGWYTVSGKAHGTTAVSFRMRGGGRDDAFAYSLAVDPGASVLHASHGTLGAEQTLSVVRYDSGFTHTITYACGGKSGIVCSKSGETSILFTPPMELAAENTAGTTVPVTFSLQTWVGDTALGEPAVVTVHMTIPDSVKLTAAEGWVTAAPHNTGAVEGMGCYVQGYSKALVTFDLSKVTMAYGATVESCALQWGAESVTAAPYETSELSVAGEISLKCTLTDSRGRSVTETLTIQVQPYAKPVLSDLQVYRCNSLGEASDTGLYIAVQAAAGISGLSGENTGQLQVRYRTSVGGYGVYETIQNGVLQVIGGGNILTTNSYVVELLLTDRLGNTAMYSKVIPTESVFFSGRAGGDGAGFGKHPESENLLEVAWNLRVRQDAEVEGDVTVGGELSAEMASLTALTVGGKSLLDMFYPVNSIYVGYSHTSPAQQFGGTWTRLTNTFLWGCDANGDIGITGGEMTHTLSVDEMPSHNHTVTHRGYRNNASQAGNQVVSREWLDGDPPDAGYEVSYTGGGAAHNNMPPYVNVAIWRRTA